ncbi:prepilin-type N-terminal cleavage/methylation domain-containing protein [Clostridium sp. JS66]|uniref:prepilin-type N-terminal cleavage/methylation domain-containing protein n=1 Tax=Clostridium sp. JS66 TaxID=3064705 RepID=UPI00298EA469|nr:prepilin-type N-terminal cleavage/methylation domain-containing protein [Clostridium sp. JS66]WPC40929.1 prepilin-type N-terminal cleavage/methylation domain-containing protein [Clostridium sp. JS66]
MLILKKKKGFTLIEVLCAITLFSILFITCLRTELNALTLEKYNQSAKKYLVCMECIKNNMIYNFNYNDIQNLKDQGRYYCSINTEEFDNFKGENFSKLFTKSKPENKPYMVMNIDGDKVFKVNLKLYVQILNKERIMECEFYKGKYKK